MRLWQIIVASATAATIVGLLFLVQGVPPRAELLRLFVAGWPAIAVVWLAVYGVAALVLTTATAFVEAGGFAVRRARDGWARRYLVRLTAAQYFTSLLALLGFGVSRVPVETAPFLVLPSLIGGSPALAAGGAVGAVGLLGGLFLTAAIVTAESRELRSPAPGMRAGRLVKETVELSRDQGPAPAIWATDVAQLAEVIERGQRAILEAVKDLAIAVRRLRWEFDEIKLVLQERGSERSSEPGSVSPSAIEDAASDLRAAAAAFDASVARLGEMAALLSANETPAVAGRDVAMSRGVRAQLSAELQALLRDMTPAADNGDPPG